MQCTFPIHDLTLQHKVLHESLDSIPAWPRIPVSQQIDESVVNEEELQVLKPSAVRNAESHSSSTQSTPVPSSSCTLFGSGTRSRHRPSTTQCCLISLRSSTSINIGRHPIWKHGCSIVSLHTMMERQLPSTILLRYPTSPDHGLLVSYCTIISTILVTPTLSKSFTTFLYRSLGGIYLQSTLLWQVTKADKRQPKKLRDVRGCIVLR